MTSQTEHEDDDMSDWHKEWEATLIRGHHFVSVTTTEVPPIPAGANPFHYDHISMGTDLTRGWIIMHEGFDRPEDPRGHNYMTLVNTRSGQRIQLTFTKAESQPLPDPTSAQNQENQA